VQPRGVDVPEIGVGFVENQREVCSSQNHRFDTVALD
jgi:hypothetical protein